MHSYNLKYNNYRIKLFSNFIQLSLSNYGDLHLYICINILRTRYLLSIYSLSYCNNFDIDLEVNYGSFN